MPISNRDLPAGTTLTATYKKQAYTCSVIETPEGKRYRSPEGKEYKSPSAAGSAVMNGTACNGWAFWSLQGDEANAPVREPKVKAVKAAKAAPAATKTMLQVKKLRKQDGAPEGETRWYCSACQDGFLFPKNTTPAACPEGHPRVVADESDMAGLTTEAEAE